LASPLRDVILNTYVHFPYRNCRKTTIKDMRYEEKIRKDLELVPGRGRTTPTSEQDAFATTNAGESVVHTISLKDVRQSRPFECAEIVAYIR